MKICFWCDLHLPVHINALQYDVLRWALDNVKINNPDCVIFAGDITCDGNIDVYKHFISVLDSLLSKTIFIPGNSDLRDMECAREVHAISSPCKNNVGNINIYALNDSNRTISDEEFTIVDEASANSIVFMHHPPSSLLDESKIKFLKWRKTHPDTKLFFGHCHKSYIDNNDVSLQAMDPDKAIGESPCITYYDTSSGEFAKEYYLCPPPTDIGNYLGISCYNACEYIRYAIENKLANIELRPGFIDENIDEVAKLINSWRKEGGMDFSIHLPDVAYENGKVIADKNFDRFMEYGKFLGADRFTQHVPKISVAEANEVSLGEIAEFLANGLNSFEKNIVIGVENMHMTSRENPDSSRRFGYIPEECLRFMNILSEKCHHKVGINFDIGHARNNMPYSQNYQISTWLCMLGEHIVGYHIHQVTLDENGFHNHCAIDDVYGRLISYASLFRYWSECRINKAPFIFEMRGDNAYDITLKTFKKHLKDV